jgi:hypothetical protein
MSRLCVAAEQPQYPLVSPRRIIPVFLIITVHLFIGAAHASPEAVATVSSIHGTVSIKKPGREKAVSASRGEDISVGDDIVTGTGSAVQVTFSDGSFANLFERSSLRVNQYAFDPDSSRRTALIRVMNGRARFVVPRPGGKGSRFIVETETATITPSMVNDFGVQVGDAETEVVALSSSVVVKNIKTFVVGQVSLGINQKTIIPVNRTPSQPEILSPGERKAYTRDIRRTR